MYGYVLDEGSGPTVVMAHGTMMDHTMFAPQVDALKDSYRVIAYDQRSRADGYDIPYTLRDVADDCGRLLDDRGVERCILLGMSMGGFMATEFLRHHADRVRALVLVGSQVGTDSEEQQVMNTRLFQQFDHEGPVSVELAGEVASAVFGRTTQHTNPDLVRHWVERWTTFPARSVLREAQSWIAKDDYTATTRGFDRPVLVVHGEDDVVLPVEEKTRAMSDAFPDVEIVRVPDAGHFVNLEAPETTNDVLRGFLDRVTAR